MTRRAWMAVALVGLVALTSGCRTTFDLHPDQLPLEHSGHMQTRTGKVVPIPEDLTGTLVAPKGSRLMTDKKGRVVTAQLVPKAGVDEAEEHGLRSGDIEFKGALSVRRGHDQHLIVLDKRRRVVRVDPREVDYVEIVDRKARRAKIAAIVVPPSVVGAALVAAVIWAVVSSRGSGSSGVGSLAGMN